ncbi:MAG: helix-turn-helix transcriptional regulator [Mucilaginibacter sp.]|nr:helix-turn-helix transcriptional regulator [Mucilaginibacter sp.]
MHNGEKVKSIIRRSRYSVSELAAALKVTRRTVYNWLNDQNLKRDTIYKIGQLLRHDFSIEFPNLFRSRDFQFDGPLSFRINPSESEYFKDRYLELLQKYNDLLRSTKGASHKNKKS